MLQEQNNIEEQLIIQSIENQNQMNNLNNAIIEKVSISKGIIKILKIVGLILILTITDIYFGSLYSLKCSYTKKLVMNINLYNNIQIGVNTLWIIFIILIITNTKNNKFKNINEIIYIFILYYLFSITWNIIGTYLFSELLNGDLCNNKIIYNYLYSRIVINYLFNIYKMLDLIMKCKI